MKGVQCYELFGGIALKIHTFSFSFSMTLATFIDNHIGNIAFEELQTVTTVEGLLKKIAVL